MAKRPQSFRGVELTMKYSDCNQVINSSEVSDDILEVSNLPEQISKEHLELYFESPKSGGCSSGVKNVTLLRPGVAKVLFSSSESELLFFVHNLIPEQHFLSPQRVPPDYCINFRMCVCVSVSLSLSCYSIHFQMENEVSCLLYGAFLELD
jgi:hypothetical protein